MNITPIKKSSSSQIVMISNNRTAKYLPYAFSEQGVAMLSGILNSEKAVKMNIEIMRAFVAIRKITLSQKDLKKQLQEVKKRIGNHDVQISQIYEAIENLLSEKVIQEKWEERKKIGFK